MVVGEPKQIAAVGSERATDPLERPGDGRLERVARGIDQPRGDLRDQRLEIQLPFQVLLRVLALGDIGHQPVKIGEPSILAEDALGLLVDPALGAVGPEHPVGLPEGVTLRLAESLEGIDQAAPVVRMDEIEIGQLARDQPLEPIAPTANVRRCVDHGPTGLGCPVEGDRGAGIDDLGGPVDRRFERHLVGHIQIRAAVPEGASAVPGHRGAQMLDPAQLARAGVDTKPQRLESVVRVLAMKMHEIACTVIRMDDPHQEFGVLQKGRGGVTADACARRGDIAVASVLAHPVGPVRGKIGDDVVALFLNA